MDSATVFTWLQQYVAWREQPDSSNPHSHVGLSFNGNKKTFHSWPASYDWKHWTEHLQFPLSEVQEKTLVYFCNRAPDDSQHLNGRMTNPAVRIFILRWKRGSAPSPISERSMKTMHRSITRKFSLLKNYNRTIALKQCWTKRRSDTSLCGSISWT